MPLLVEREIYFPRREFGSLRQIVHQMPRRDPAATRGRDVGDAVRPHAFHGARRADSDSGCVAVQSSDNRGGMGVGMDAGAVWEFMAGGGDAWMENGEIVLADRLLV